MTRPSVRSGDDDAEDVEIETPPERPPSYVPAAPLAPRFHCPNPKCFAYTIHQWGSLAMRKQGEAGSVPLKSEFIVSRCTHCGHFTLWHKSTPIFPAITTAPPPAADLPDDVAIDYDEARNVHPHSARASAALLRLAVQKLMPHLGEKGKKLDDDIASLVQKGLPVLVQQSLDSVRVVGNNAVHPGVINLDDKPETALALFNLVNFIVEKMITEPKHVQAIYAALPQGAKDAIDKRDGKP